ncbi:aldehyde dehydrogenase family protein [Paremcibacter congregatus]|uniref:Aldehyde dehydrogenase n=1 Tax=Paremcibacter congregatus TaxID=2043170 RepID=A0A2G4YMQ6_9PROT|nr:aldehyde dehydrogenase family protein [Paremcibacter congregatus]PHZ83585.1 aldehyde dehydrogenase [Paremcibacter congregatus]QDE28328.1 aldehyde dehydrogenase family protein [Paremcibacter congregatus]
MTASVQPEKLSEKVRDFISSPRKMLLNGAWVNSASGKTFDSLNPATGAAIVAVAEGDQEDIDRAVRAARAAFEDSPWSNMNPTERERCMHRLANLMEENADTLAELEALDNGKNVAVARAVDIQVAIDYIRYMAGWPTKITGNTLPLSVPYAPGAKFMGYTLKEPVGVVGQIIPWNFPALMVAWKLGPALASGCTVVLKPAEETPLTALYIGELICQAGFPDGVVNIIPGYGHTAGAALTTHPEVDKIAFTGSTEVGKIIVKAAADTMKNVTMELGGKSPAVILPDADLDIAIPGAASAIFFNQGQVCCAGSRLFVPDNLYDQVTEGLAQAASALQVGSGLNPENMINPVVSQTQFDRVMGYINSGREEGADVIAGGGRRGDQGYFIEPTVLGNTTRDMKVVREEIFGPVVCVQRYSDVSEIPALANDTVYGLGASIWTRDVGNIINIVPKIKSGTVWVNCHNILDIAMPFGGYKQSGFGKDMGAEALDAYLETKSVCIMA